MKHTLKGSGETKPYRTCPDCRGVAKVTNVAINASWNPINNLIYPAAAR
jgi:hypothetical protein